MIIMITFIIFYLYIQVGVFLSSSRNSLLTESLLRTSTMVKPLNCSSARMSCVVPVTGELTFKSNNQELRNFFFFFFGLSLLTLHYFHYFQSGG